MPSLGHRYGAWLGVGEAAVAELDQPHTAGNGKRMVHAMLALHAADPHGFAKLWGLHSDGVACRVRTRAAVDGTRRRVLQNPDVHVEEQEDLAELQRQQVDARQEIAARDIIIMIMR